MLPPPPIQKPMQKEEENAAQNDISTIQSEVEKKLEIQKENNRDVMETIYKMVEKYLKHVDYSIISRVQNLNYKPATR